MNRKDARDFNVPEAPIETLFSYFRLAECTYIEQFKQDMKTNAEMPPLPKGYVWGPLVIGRDVDFEGPPAIALPMYCVICRKFLDHMSTNCPRRNEEGYAAWIENFVYGNNGLLGNNKFSEEDA